MANQKYFLGCERSRLTSSFTYLIRNSLVSLLEAKHIPYTFDIHEEGITEAILPGGGDAFAFAAVLKKKHIPMTVLALEDESDFALQLFRKDPTLVLSFDAVNAYKKAKCLWVHFPSQENFLRRAGIKTPVKTIPLTPSFAPEKEMSEVEKRAFRCYYGLQENKEIVFSYGNFSFKQDVEVFQTIAQNLPEKVFFFFGHGEKEAMKQKTLESITRPGNIFFVPVLREELYRSALASCSRLLLIGDHLSYPQLLVDCIHKGIPITSYKPKGFPELINEETSDLCETFAPLFHSLNGPVDEKKVARAKEVALTYEKKDLSLA